MRQTLKLGGAVALGACAAMAGVLWLGQPIGARIARVGQRLQAAGGGHPLTSQAEVAEEVARYLKPAPVVVRR